MIAPQTILPDDPDLLPAVRELLTQYPCYQCRGAFEIAEGLFYLRFMNYRPHEVAVEGVLEVLTVEGVILP
jgi:hypothetical protein